MSKIKKLLLTIAIISVIIPTVSYALTFGSYIGSGAGTTKLLVHFEGANTDSSGNALAGTDTNMTYGLAYGRFGQGGNFDGTSKISYGNNCGFEYNQTFTLSAWIKTTTAGYSGIITKQSQTTGQGYAFFVNNTGVLELQLNSSGAGSSVKGATSVIDGKWHYVVATNNGSSSINGAFVYVDGRDDSSTRAGSVTSGLTTSINCVLGARDTGQLFFNGYMDDAFVESSFWTTTQAAKYYTYAKGRFGIQ